MAEGHSDVEDGWDHLPDNADIDIRDLSEKVKEKNNEYPYTALTGRI